MGLVTQLSALAAYRCLSGGISTFFSSQLNQNLMIENLFDRAALANDKSVALVHQHFHGVVVAEEFDWAGRQSVGS